MSLVQRRLRHNEFPTMEEATEWIEGGRSWIFDLGSCVAFPCTVYYSTTRMGELRKGFLGELECAAYNVLFTEQ